MKKILAVIAAAAVALTLVGCVNLGDAKTSGSKWSKTFKLDATGEIKDADGEDATYARGFASLSTSKFCSAIETTITLPKEDKKDKVLNIPVSDQKNPLTNQFYKSVVGLAFDVHEYKKADNKSYYSFVLVGVKPGDGGYYIEYYEDVLKDNLKESMNTNQGSIGGKYTEVAAETNGWAGTISGVDQEDCYTWKIRVTQDTAGTYKVLINDVVKGTYTRALTEDETKDTKHNGKAYGQVFLYGNAPIGTKIEAKFASNKDKNVTVGLFADEDEF